MTHGTEIPTLEDIEDSKKAMDDIQSFTYDTVDNFIDAKGVTRDTVTGRIKKMGYTVPIPYAVGIVFAANDNVKTVEEASIVYAPLASSLPFTTSGTFIGDDDARFFVIQGLTEAAADTIYVRNYNTLADWRSDPFATVDVTVTAAERTIGKGGGGTGDVISGILTANTFEIVQHNTLPLSWVLRFDTILDAKQFGIIADNIADDFAAWTNLFTVYRDLISAAPGDGDTASFDGPIIRGPIGTSLSSKPIVLPDYLFGDFSTTKFDRHPSWSEVAGTYLVTSSDLYQAKFGGLAFDDVDFCLEIKNSNLDQGTIYVSGLRFSGGDRGIRVQAQSSIVVIEYFKSDNLPHFLHVEVCDRCVLDKGWITQGALTADRDATMSTQEGLLVIKEVLGVPKQHSGAEVAWINNLGGSVDVRGMRFGGEPGSCTAVNNFAPIKSDVPIFPTMVSVQDSECYSVDTQTASQQSCIIRLFALPNIIRFHNNRGMIDTQDVITWGLATDQDAELAILATNLGATQYSFISIQGAVGGGASTPLDSLPNNLKSIFSPSGLVTLIPVTDSSTVSVCDSGIVPGNDNVYELVMVANMAASANAGYRSTWTGHVALKVGFNGADIVKRLELANTFESIGGPAFASNLIVTAHFLSGVTELEEVDQTDTTAQIRIKIGGFDAGNEGANFKGYLKEITPE